jgi:hypothetical protein
MARISTYPLDTAVVGTDKWIGSDSQQLFATKNFTADAVAEFINGYNKVESTSLRYEYRDYNVHPSMEPGTISFSSYIGGNTDFSTVTSFKISQTQLQRGLDSLANFYSNPLIGSMVMISQCDKISNWGAFKWVNSIQDGINPTFYDITLQYVSGPGFFEDTKDYFISILTYDTNLTSDKNFVWTQSVLESTWQVTHNLNKYCSVEVVNDTNDIIYPNIEYTSPNTVTITFSTPQKGQAFFN